MIGSSIRACAVTGHDGHYLLPALDGAWEFAAKGPEATSHLDSPDLHAPVTVSGADAMKDFAVAPAAALITGSVRDVSGSPLPFVRVCAQGTALDGTTYQTEASTNAEGRYVLGVLPGSWEVNVDLGDSPHSYLVRPAAQIVVIPGPPEPQLGAADFTCDSGGAVSGVVTDAGTGAPIAGIHVYTWGDNGLSEWLAGTYTGCDGSYLLKGLRAGMPGVYVGVCPSCVPAGEAPYDYDLLWWNALGGSVEPSGAEEISLAETTTTAGIDFALNACPDSDGDGLSDCLEEGFYHTSPSSPDTDGDGLNDKYEVDHMPCCDPLRSLADINKDGSINTVDFNTFKNAYRTHASVSDVNCSGSANTVDFNLFKNAYRNR